MRRPIVHLLIALAGLTVGVDAIAQSLSLGMGRRDFVQTFGEPEKVGVNMQTGVPRESLRYGKDSFIFTEGTLSNILVETDVFSLAGLCDGGVKIGDSPTFLQNKKAIIRELPYGRDNSLWICRLDDEERRAGILVKDGVVSRIAAIDLSKSTFGVGEFRSFYKGKYKPMSSRPEDSLWPAVIEPDWRKANIRMAADTLNAVCCVPFTGERIPSAKYDGKDCGPVGERLMSLMIQDGSRRYRQNIIAVVPQAGLAPGDGFTGLVLHINSNSAVVSLWEYFHNGTLLYSWFKNPSVIKDSEALVSERLNHVLRYEGGPDVISEEDWLLLSANRSYSPIINEKAFPEGWTVDDIVAERNKYTFSNTENVQFGKPAPAVEESGKKVEDRKLSGFVGKINNLSSILVNKTNPVKLDYDLKNANGSSRGTLTIYASNEDFCDYTLKSKSGLTWRVYASRTEISDFPTTESYRTYRGHQVARVNVKYPYAFPVADGAKVKMMEDPRERFLSFAVIMNDGDPVHAMRAGVVCKTENENGVLVYHKDCTFAAYMNLADIQVEPGDLVYPGMVIGKSAAGRLSISVFYLDSNKVSSDSPSPFTHITPYFRSSEGDVKLEPGKEYTALVDDEIITREMSNAQKRSYNSKSKK